MKIFICGFTGAGKSSLLESFKKNNSGFELIDLDLAIAVDLNVEPSRLGDWILLNGFPLFREKEKAKVKNLLESKSSMVVALGGGTLTEESLQLIRSNGGVLVFLDVDFGTCLARVKDDPARPLTFLPEETLQKIYEERRALYEKADLTLLESEIVLCELPTLVHNLEKLKSMR